MNHKESDCAWRHRTVAEWIVTIGALEQLTIEGFLAFVENHVLVTVGCDRADGFCAATRMGAAAVRPAAGP
mgnify:CR=1 FL=1